jgi:hypothetical protein
MEIEKSTRELKLLAKVVARTDLKRLFLLNCEVQRSLDALSHERVSASISSDGILSEEKQDCFIAKAIFTFVGTPIDKNEVKEDKQVVSIKAEYLLEYALLDKADLSKEELVNFCNINAVYNAWPFWREFLQTMSNKMGLPTITLPLLKFRHARKDGGKEERKKKEDVEDSDTIASG